MDRRQLLACLASTGIAGCLRLEGGSEPETTAAPVTETETPTAISTSRAQITDSPTEAPVQEEHNKTPSEEATSTEASDPSLSISADWPQFQYNAANTGHHPGTSGPTEDIERVWTFERNGTIPDERSQESEWNSFNPVISDGTAYVSSQDGSIYAIDTTSGEQQWSFSEETEFSDSGGRKCTPAVSGATVIAEGSGGHLYGIDTDSGNSKWVFRRNIGVSPVTPTVRNGTVYSENKGDVLAIDIASGSLRWIRENLGSLVYQAVASGGLYVPDQGHGSDVAQVYALDAESGSTLWTTEGPSTGCAVRENTVYTARKTDGVTAHLDGNPKLYALDRANGSVKWETDLPEQPTTGEPPAVAWGKVFIGLSDGNVYSYDVSDGTQLWSTTTIAEHVSGTVTAVDGAVYFGTGEGLHCHAAEDGTRNWSYPLDSPPNTPTIVDNTVLVGTHGGRVHGFKERT